MDLPATDPGSDLCDLSDSGDENYSRSNTGPSRRDAGYKNDKYKIKSLCTVSFRTFIDCSLSRKL